MSKNFAISYPEKAEMWNYFILNDKKIMQCFKSDCKKLKVLIS